MRTPRAGRRPGGPAAALAWAVAAAAGLAAGLAVAGWIGAAAATGPPVPASAVAQLTAIASRAASDPSPAQVTAVLTTRAKALTSATPGDFVPGSGGVRVYLVTMRGHFTAYDASVPPGAAAPSGSYLSLVLDARTFQVLDLGLSPKPPPVQPALLGPVTYLSGRPR